MPSTATLIQAGENGETASNWRDDERDVEGGRQMHRIEDTDSRDEGHQPRGLKRKSGIELQEERRARNRYPSVAARSELLSVLR